jgi:MFS family permease
VRLLTDSIGGIRVLLTGAILFSIGSILFPLAPNLTLLYISRSFVGFGASMFYVSLVQIAAQAFPKKMMGDDSSWI